MAFTNFLVSANRGDYSHDEAMKRKTFLYIITATQGQLTSRKHNIWHYHISPYDVDVEDMLADMLPEVQCI